MKVGSYKFKWRDMIRWGIHIPAGGIPAYFILHPWLQRPVYRWTVLGIVIIVAFFVYEGLEDWRIGDHSFKDVFGSLIALIAAGFVIRIWFMD